MDLHRQRADHREHMGGEGLLPLGRRCGPPCGGVCFDVGGGGLSEGLRLGAGEHGRDALAGFDRDRVLPGAKHRPRGDRALASLGQGHGREAAETEMAPPAAEAVTKDPAPRSAARDLQAQPTAIAEDAALGRVLDRQCRQSSMQSRHRRLHFTYPLTRPLASAWGPSAAQPLPRFKW